MASYIHLIQCRINTMVYIAANTQSKTFFPGNGIPNCFGMRAELKKMVKEFIVHPETKNRQITDFKLNESKCKTRQKNYCTNYRYHLLFEELLQGKITRSCTPVNNNKLCLNLPNMTSGVELEMLLE